MIRTHLGAFSEVADFIGQHPDQYDQSRYQTVNEIKTGTPCCVASIALLVRDKLEPRQLPVDVTIDMFIRRMARYIYGLTDAEAEVLFARTWPWYWFLHKHGPEQQELESYDRQYRMDWTLSRNVIFVQPRAEDAVIILRRLSLGLGSILPELPPMWTQDNIEKWLHRLYWGYTDQGG